MSPDNREAVIRAARDWIGTPYRHQAGVMGAGADCLGLVRGVWQQVTGRIPETPPPYSSDWAEQGAGEPLLDGLRRHLSETPTGQARPGDCLVFRMALGAPAKHCAIQSGPDRIIHAYWGRSVVETRLVPWWTRRITAAFTF